MKGLRTQLVPELIESQNLMDPSQLSAATTRAAHALLEQGQSANTLRSYGSAMRYWCAWYAARFGQELSLPVAVPAVIQFIVDHAVRRIQPAEGAAGLDVAVISSWATELPTEIDKLLVEAKVKSRLGPPAIATVVHRISVLSKVHQMRSGSGDAAAPPPLNELANPCSHPAVRELLARARRAAAQRGERPRRQAALTKDPLSALLATCDASPTGIRDRALLLFAWSSGGRRRSEVAAARIEDISTADRGAFVFHLGASKANQRGETRPEDLKPIAGTAAIAIQAWLSLLKAQGIASGPLFRRVLRGGRVALGLSPAAVRDIVLKRCAIAGLEGAYSSHSLRSGFVTEAGRRNVPVPEAMAMTGHHSVSTFMRYFRAGSSLSGPASTMMDDDG